MQSLVKWLVVGVAIVVVLAIAALVALPSLVDTPRVQALIASSAAQALGRPVHLQKVSVRVFPRPAVRIRGLEVAEDPAFGATPFLRLDEADLRLHVWPLLGGRVEFGDLVLKEPAIAIIQAPDGRLNIASLGAARETPAPARGGRAAGGGRASGGGGAAGAAALATKVRIVDGVVTYEARSAGATASRYRVEKLDVTLAGAPGPISIAGGARVMPGDLAVKITDASVTAAGRSLADARLRGTLALDGKNLGALAAVAMGPSPALAGAVKGRLTLAGTVGAPSASGDLEISDLGVTQTQAQCPEPKRRTLGLGPTGAPVAWEASRLTARPLTTSIAGGAVTTNVTATFADGLRVDLADLAIKGLPVEKVLVDYLCQGYAVTGPLDLTGHAAARPADLWRTLAGAGHVRIGPGKVVGAQALRLLGEVARVGGAINSLLNADLPASLFAAPLDFDSITATYTITDGVMKTPDLLYTSKALRISAAGTYGLATGALDMDVTLDYGRGQVRARVTGTASSPSIRVNPASVLQGIKPGDVQRGLQDLLKRFR